MKFLKNIFGGKILSEKVSKQIVGNGNEKLLKYKFFLKVFILFLFFGLFLNPEFGNKMSSKSSDKYNFVFLFDNSISMLAKDNFEKTRLQRGKEIIFKTIEELGIGNFALLTFAKNSQISIPFTFDKTSFKSLLNNTFPSDYENSSSLKNLQDNLKIIFSKKDLRKKVVILISDGELQETFSNYAFLKNEKISIISFGLGNKKGSEIFLGKENGENIFKKFRGKNVITKLNEKFLKQISEKYFKEGEEKKFLNFIKKISFETLGKDEVLKKRNFLKEISLFIILLLIFEMFFLKRFVKILPVFIFTIIFSGCESDEWQLANQKFILNQFSESSKDFKKLSQEYFKNKKHFYNLGTSLYKEGKFGEAIKNFKKVDDLEIINSGNLEYQIGNSLYKKGEKVKSGDKKIELWEESISQYEFGLNKKIKDKKMTENKKFVEEKLKKLKKQRDKQQNKMQKKKKEQEKKNKKKGKGQGKIKLDKKSAEQLKKEVDKLNKEELDLKGFFDKNSQEKFKLKDVPGNFPMKDLKNILGNPQKQGLKKFQTEEKDW